MNKLLSVTKKELLHYFYSPMAYVVLWAFLLVNGFLFYVILSALSKTASPPISPLSIIFGGSFFFYLLTIVITVVITMRLGAEERKQGTFETLLTSPINDFEIVMGKFLSAFIFYLIAWLLTLIYVFIVKAYQKDLDFGPIISSYLGTLLLGMFFISIGLFASMISKNQIVSAVIATLIITMLLGITFLGFISSGITREIFQYLDLLTIMDNFSKGIVDSRNLIYLLSGTAFFIALSEKSLEARRWQ